MSFTYNSTDNIVSVDTATTETAKSLADFCVTTFGASSVEMDTEKTCINIVEPCRFEINGLLQIGGANLGMSSSRQDAKLVFGANSEIVDGSSVNVSNPFDYVAVNSGGEIRVGEYIDTSSNWGATLSKGWPSGIVIFPHQALAVNSSTDLTVKSGGKFSMYDAYFMGKEDSDFESGSTVECIRSYFYFDSGGAGSTADKAANTIVDFFGTTSFTDCYMAALHANFRPTFGGTVDFDGFIRAGGSRGIYIPNDANQVFSGVQFFEISYNRDLVFILNSFRQATVKVKNTPQRDSLNVLSQNMGNNREYTGFIGGDVDFRVSDSSGDDLQGVKIYIRDTNNGRREPEPSTKHDVAQYNTDYVADEIYYGTTDVNGELSLDLLTSIRQATQYGNTCRGTITSSGTTVTGTGTKFLTDLSYVVGDADRLVIKVGGNPEVANISSINSDTSITLSSAFSSGDVTDVTCYGFKGSDYFAPEDIRKPFDGIVALYGKSITTINNYTPDAQLSNNIFSSSLPNDTGITESTEATVDAYTELENTDKFYDRAISEFINSIDSSYSKTLSPYVIKTGDLIDLGIIDLNIDATAGTAFSYSESEFLGTGTITISGTSITGSGTLFTTELKVGQRIKANGVSRVIASITDSTNLTIDRALDSDWQWESEAFNFINQRITIKASTYTGDLTTIGSIILSNGAEIVGTFTDANGTINQQPISITNISAGSRIRIYNVTTSTETVNTVVSGTSYTSSYQEGTGYNDGDTVRVYLTKLGKKEWVGDVIDTSNGFSVLVSQVDDDVYTALGVDGTTVTKFQADYPNNEVDLIIGSDWTMAELYAWWSNNLTTEDGIRSFFGGITAIDEANFRINSAVVNLFLDNTTSASYKQTDNRRFFRDTGDGYPIKKPTTSGYGLDAVWREKVLIASSDDIQTTINAILVDTGTTLPAQITALNNLSATEAQNAVSGTTLDKIQKLAVLIPERA